MHLQENTNEAKEMRQKVCTLLLSGEEKNLLLALQLIESGGMHPDFYVPLYILAVEELWQTVQEEDRPYFQLLATHLPEKEMHDLIERTTFHVWWGIFIKRLSEEVSLRTAFIQQNWKEIAVLAFYRSGWGAGTCYAHQLLPTDKIMEKVAVNLAYGLDMWDFELDDLFPELANVETDTIMLTECRLENLSPATWQNPYIETVHLWEERQDKIDTLRGYFPNASYTVQTAKGTTVHIA